MTYTCNTCGQTKTESIATLPAKDNTVTYTGSTSKDYDGNVIALESDKITRSGDGAITFMYKESTEEDSAYTATAPKNAGTYNVKISVAKTAEWKAAELVVEYTINKVVLPLQTLTMTYEVLPQPTGTGIGTYKSKTFTSVDGLPEGVTIKVYPYNKAENGTFTVSSSGSTTYNIGAGSDNIEEFRTALYAAASNLEANQFIARISLGPNYTLPEDRGVATLKVTPKEITGDFTFSRVYDGTNTFRIDGADLLDYGIYEADKDDVYLLLRLNSKDAESKKIQTASLLKKVDSKKNYNYKVADEANFNVTITKKDISGLVYDLVIPILKDSSGNVIKTRTLEVGSRYGTTQKDTDITLKFEGDYDWETSAVFYNKKTNPEASVYFTMKGTAINNYELDNVQLILKNSVTDSAVKEGTLGQTYIVQAPKNVTLSNARYYKYTVVQGKTYLITLNANDNYRYTVSDEKGYIYCPDNDNKFTAQRSGELYLWIYHNDIARAYNFTLSEV